LTFTLRPADTLSIFGSDVPGNVEADVLKPIEGEAAPVAIARPELFGQSPLDRVDA